MPTFGLYENFNHLKKISFTFVTMLRMTWADNMSIIQVGLHVGIHSLPVVSLSGLLYQFHQLDLSTALQQYLSRNI